MVSKMAPSECFRPANEEEPLVMLGVEHLQQELDGLVVEDITNDMVIP
jgi:hypothetical protein